MQWILKRLLLVIPGLLCFVSGSIMASESPRIVVLTTDFVLEAKLRSVQESARSEGVDLHYHQVSVSNDEQVLADLAVAQLVLLDAPRGNDLALLQQRWGEMIDASPAPVLTVIGGQGRGQGLDSAHVTALSEYYSNGTRPNFEGFFRYWAVHVAGISQAQVPAPVVFPDAGIYHPGMPALVAATPEAYLNWRRAAGLDTGSEAGSVGVLMASSQFSGDHSALIDTMLYAMEGRGIVPWFFYFDGDDPQGMTGLLHHEGETRVDLLINMTHLRGITDRPRELASLDVPMLQAHVHRDGSVADWRQASAGMAMRTVPAFLAIPEQMGLQDTVVVAAVEQGEVVVIEEQLEHLLQRVQRTIALRRLAPQDKRLALMYWSYPPGERGVSASNLNVPRSLARLLPVLSDHGYQVTTASAESFEQSLPALLDPWQGRVELALWAEQNPDGWDALPLETYLSWYTELPEAVRERIEDRWGPPSADAMFQSDENNAWFVIPRKLKGNLVLLPQPSRAGRETGLASYHDGHSPPTHSYLAIYQYIREIHAADALIHFGTHGTQEFLPGKERGLSVFDDAALPLGDLPVIYPYITDNIGEGLQARRRGQAVLISHQTPPFAPAGLHGELQEIHDLIHEWEMLDEGPVRRRTEQAIIERVGEGSLYRDLGWTYEQIEEDFIAFEHDLHLYLHELSRDAQPLGLHEFGSHPKEQHLVTTIMQMLGEDYYRALAVDDVDELFVEDYQTLGESVPYLYLSAYLAGERSPHEENDPVLRVMLEQALHWRDAMVNNDELSSLLAALSGRYISTSSGGDPIRNPDILPTGRNTFGFDPARLPTPRAWEVGKELAEALVATHLEQHGSHPESLAVSLWSSEAMRHQGVMEAQMLHLLGLEPTWDQGGRLAALHIVPQRTLGRPRVDVVASITGVYRDQFPVFIDRLAEALEELALLEELSNPVARNAAALRERLVTQGMPVEQAMRLAAIRIFSSGSGNYGTGVPGAVFDTESWEHDEEIAAAYLGRMQYGYGAGEGMWGVRLDDINLYAENLRGVQGAILGRSSNLHGLLSTDHPFEYLGGIAMAVRSLTGTTPDLYVSNLRSVGGERNVSAAQFMAGELRSRYHHPGWISAMQDEGYAGTLELLNVVNNFFGWQVTDPSMVREDQWLEFHEIYVKDSLELGLDEWFEENNVQALQRIVERMLEAVRRDYWQPGETVLQELVERHQQLAQGAAAGRLGEYIDSLAAGFGLQSPGMPASSTVTGQRLTQVEASAAPVQDLRTVLLTALLLLLMLAGSAGQLRRQYN